MTKLQTEMPLLGHIGELRKHIIRIIIVIGIIAIAVGVNIEWFMDNIVLAPAYNTFPSIVYLNQFFENIGMPNVKFLYDESYVIQQKELAEGFNLTIKVAAIAGLIIGFPYVVWEIWKFIAPGLMPHEKKNSGFYILSTMILFFIGAAFGYYIIAPIAIQFFINYDISSHVEKFITITSIINMVMTSTLGMAIVFLFPIVTYVLSNLGILTPEFLKKYRKQAFIVVLLIAAFITPSDIVSMFVAAIPLWFLYEFSILVSKWVYHKKAKELS